jgi:hypothetical protein
MGYANMFTSHVFFPLKYHECITAMLLLLLIGLLVRMRIGNDPYLKIISHENSGVQSRCTYALDRTKSAKFTLQVLLGRIVAQPCDNQSLKCITANIRIFSRFICDPLANVHIPSRSKRAVSPFLLLPTRGGLTQLRRVLYQFLLLLLFLHHLPILHLQPTLRWHIIIVIFVLLQHRQVFSKATDRCGLALLWGVVGWRHPS